MLRRLLDHFRQLPPALRERAEASVQIDLRDLDEPPSTRRVRRLQREVDEHGLTRLAHRPGVWRRTFGPPLTADHWAGIIAFAVIASIFVGVLLVLMGVLAPIKPPPIRTPDPSATASR
jgi:hypothetical protein